MFYGKYRASVLKVDKSTGKIKVFCEDVYGEYESPWCSPCLPVFRCSCSECKNKTDEELLKAMLPKINTDVWIEFEQGNSSYPIWTGTWI